VNTPENPKAPETMAEKLAAREAERAARRAEIHEKWSAQKLLDLDKIEAIESAHGDTNIAILDVLYTEGLPACCACRTPEEPEMKRYRSSVKPKKDGEPLTNNMTSAAEELAHVVLVYPEREVFAEMCAARPGIKAQLGGLAVKLAVGRAETEGKD
jgi:hypothetical protein